MKLEQRLIGAILIQAVKDWEKGTHRAEVREFLNSPWFTELSTALDFDHNSMREKIICGQVAGQPIRSAYRKNTSNYRRKEV